ncbi:MAG: GNAT family N-acetyltransferase [Ruminococcus sp.]|nr:GNAT family N-acetyltransferase [Ruminococcus sp.]
MEGLNLIGTQPFETKRCKLRPFKLSDAQYIYKNWAGNENVVKYLTWNAHKNLDESTAYCVKMIKESSTLSNFHWIIELSEINEPIGDISVLKTDTDKREVHLGFVLGEQWWNKGIMTEVLEAVLAYLVFVIGFDKIIAEHISENKASGKVMQKCGMRMSGTNTLILKDKGNVEVPLDEYCITKQEWFAKNIRV